MKMLCWKPILSNLAEAWGEINSLESLLDSPDKGPCGERRLFHRLEHAYHHLNWAWNCRRTEEDKVWNFSERSAARWTKFPQSRDFASLWPKDRRISERYDDLPGEKVNGTLVHFELVYARNKLGILCYLAAKEAGEEWERPKGLSPEVDGVALTEAEFARRMRQIYRALNSAWNRRRDRKRIVDKAASLRRECFPSVFATGCRNMWTGGGRA